MEFATVVRARRMVRTFETTPVPADARDRVLDHLLRAPSAGFSQGMGFLVLEDPDARKHFWEFASPPGHVDDPYPGMRNAPLVIVCLSNKQVYLDRYAQPDKGFTDRDESVWPAPYWDIDTGMAALLALLTATDEGLGAAFFAVWQIDALRDHFGIPAEFHPIGAIAIGVPADDVPSPSLARGRRPRAELIHRERW